MLKQEWAEDDSSDGQVLPRGFLKSNHGKESTTQKRPKRQRYRSLKEIYASLDAIKRFEEIRADDGVVIEPFDNLSSEVSAVGEGKKKCKLSQAEETLQWMEESDEVAVQRMRGARQKVRRARSGVSTVQQRHFLRPSPLLRPHCQKSMPPKI
ncbi:hypothetical protein KSP39_PZI015123 [Platanthera zijinensis]|uniref:Uncharacterized protein n=1 Tax=Platanthera zijinensis TaxID=2320716 RepID=A0AAP0BAX4_9ASPA